MRSTPDLCRAANASALDLCFQDHCRTVLRYTSVESGPHRAESGGAARGQLRRSTRLYSTLTRPTLSQPIPSARYWRLTERLEAQRPNQQCALLPQLDPSSPFFNPEPIIWADPNHCARWAGIVESAFNPGAGLVVSPRMPRADGAVPVSAMAASGSPTVPPKISPTQAHPISASAPVPSSSKRFRRTLPHQALSGAPVLHSRSPKHAMLITRRTQLKMWCNVQDLLSGIPGVLDARIHPIKLHGFFWATALLQNVEAAQSAIRTSTPRPPPEFEADAAAFPPTGHALAARVRRLVHPSCHLAFDRSGGLRRQDVFRHDQLLRECDVHKGASFSRADVDMHSRTTRSSASNGPTGTRWPR